MKCSTKAFIMMIVTITLMRFGVLILPEIDIEIFGIVIHHFWFGIALIIFALLVRKQAYAWIIAAIGLGLSIDELVFMLLGAGGDAEYFSLISWISIAPLTIVVFIFRNYLFKPFMGRSDDYAN